ncbi:hypothetical protein I552_2505 [Mycobacterium xenopi 3993]|nr:hypothetical protein I552_2505 [Mycobacterium xenopi 3993]
MPAMSELRAAVDRAAPQLRQRQELRYTLLDDVPVATLISGHALSPSGVLGVTAKSGYLPGRQPVCRLRYRRFASELIRGWRPGHRYRSDSTRARRRRRCGCVASNGAVTD